MTEQLYKVLGPDRQPFHGGSGQWPEIGVWTPKLTGTIIPCQRGYHLARLDQLIEWLGPHIFEVETRGDLIDHSDKFVAREVRLTRDTGWTVATCRLFAADCAEHVLDLFERVSPDDKRPRQAIEAARAFARGEIDDVALASAASAAWAAWDASAAWAARAAARAAAWAGAGDAAGDAARAAARAAAGAAEKAWQIERLRQYLSGEVSA